MYKNFPALLCMHHHHDEEWVDCVQSDVQPFGIVERGNRKAMAFKTEVGVETATEGGRRSMAW